MSLVQKLSVVMKGIKTLHEDEKHSQGWSFASVGSMYNAVRPLLAEAGVMIFPKMLEVEQKETGSKSAKGNSQISTTIKWIMQVTDGSESMECPWQSSALDYDDKGINKAATTAMKYFLRTLFMISTSDDVDPDHDTPQTTRRNSAPPKAVRPTLPQVQIQADDGISESQVTAISIALRELGFDFSNPDHKQRGREFVSWLANVTPPVESIKHFTKKEAQRALDRLGDGENGHYRTDKKKATEMLEKFADWNAGVHRLGSTEAKSFEDLGGN